jgi:DNA-binding response OmpR family regulator
MTRGGRILVVNRNLHNLDLLDQVLSQVGYVILEAADLSAFDQALAHPERLTLALVDITGFDAEIWARCERLRENGIPLLLIFPRPSAAVEQAGERHGARSILVKPLVVRDLVTLIDLLAEA